MHEVKMRPSVDQSRHVGGGGVLLIYPFDQAVQCVGSYRSAGSGTLKIWLGLLDRVPGLRAGFVSVPAKGRIVIIIPLRM